ncbi:hypothetical protein N9L40_03160 [Rhodobacteraceae bacterium]|nr:hypothetical protein [Paracoccaceae bacterium]
MARKRSGEEDILRLVRGVEVHCNSGMDVVRACRTDGVSARPIMAGVGSMGHEPCALS